MATRGSEQVELLQKQKLLLHQLKQQFDQQQTILQGEIQRQSHLLQQLENEEAKDNTQSSVRPCHQDNNNGGTLHSKPLSPVVEPYPNQELQSDFENITNDEEQQGSKKSSSNKEKRSYPSSQTKGNGKRSVITAGKSLAKKIKVSKADISVIPALPPLPPLDDPSGGNDTSHILESPKKPSDIDATTHDDSKKAAEEQLPSKMEKHDCSDELLPEDSNLESDDDVDNGIVKKRIVMNEENPNNDKANGDEVIDKKEKKTDLSLSAESATDAGESASCNDSDARKDKESSEATDEFFTLAPPMSKEELEQHLESLTSPCQFTPRRIGRKFLPLVRKLCNHEYGWVFRDPVDPVELGIPDYFDIVEHPMDLALVEKKLENGVYRDVDSVERDIKLVFENAILFNGHDSDVGEMAKKLLALFDEDLKTVMKGR